MRRAFASLALVLTASEMRGDDATIAKALRSLAIVHQIANVIEIRRATQIERVPDWPLDPWGNAMRVDVNGDSYRIVAAGADAKFDESTWTAAGQFTGVDGDVVFENGKLVRSNRNWLVPQVVTAAESGAAIQELRQAEALFMTSRTPVMRDVMASRVTTVAMRQIAAQIAAYAREHGGAYDGFALPPTRDAWGTDLQFTNEGGTYRIVSAGSDRTFDAESWERAPKASTAEDIVLKNGIVARAHDEAEILAYADLTTTPIPQPVNAPSEDERFTYIRPGDPKGATPPKVIARVEPHYPELYRKLHISGAVTLGVAVTETGAIERIALLRSVAPDLDQSAIDAVRQWKFAPATREGQAVPVMFAVSVNFKLTQ
jgi:TonB family protein